MVDDDAGITSFLSRHLPARGFVTDACATAVEALTMTCATAYDIVVLDLNLPDMKGGEVLNRLRASTHAPPTLMLTATSDTLTKVRLLDTGADDYMVKPFSLDELVARMRALLRRSADATPSLLKVGDLELDSVRQTVTRAGGPIILTTKEYMLLEYLLHHQGWMVAKSALVEHVWNADADPFSNALDTHMANLRRKLGAPPVIHTVHGRGYRIE